VRRAPFVGRPLRVPADLRQTSSNPDVVRQPFCAPNRKLRTRPEGYFGGGGAGARNNPLPISVWRRLSSRVHAVPVSWGNTTSRKLCNRDRETLRRCPAVSTRGMGPQPSRGLTPLGAHSADLPRTTTPASSEPSQVLRIVATAGVNQLTSSPSAAPLPAPVSYDQQAGASL
jgi:hypothetical protein